MEEDKLFCKKCRIRISQKGSSKRDGYCVKCHCGILASKRMKERYKNKHKKIQKIVVVTQTSPLFKLLKEQYKL